MSWNTEQRDGEMSFRFEKEIFQKKLEKSFGGSKICLTFASAFQKKAYKEEFFERFRYKQASSTRFVWDMTNNRNRQYLISKDTDSVLEQIKTFSDENTWYFTMKSLILAQDER